MADLLISSYQYETSRGAKVSGYFRILGMGVRRGRLIGRARQVGLLGTRRGSGVLLLVDGHMDLIGHRPERVRCVVAFDVHRTEVGGLARRPDGVGAADQDD